MLTEQRTENKFRVWVRRYLPCEIAGTVCELGGAGTAYLMTGSPVTAAIVATIGASVGYYAAAFVAAVRWSYRAQTHRSAGVRAAVAGLLAFRSVAIEFGPAELIDSLLIRPVAFYLGPQLFGNMIAGWIFGKLVADLGFYACAIFSYERFNPLLAQRRPNAEEVDDELVPSVAAA